jgi:hypothetical protein
VFVVAVDRAYAAHRRTDQLLPSLSRTVIGVVRLTAAPLLTIGACVPLILCHVELLEMPNWESVTVCVPFPFGLEIASPPENSLAQTPLNPGALCLLSTAVPRYPTPALLVRGTRAVASDFCCLPGRTRGAAWPTTSIAKL